MKRPQWLIFGVTALLILGTAGWLARYRSIQRLGPPGLKVSQLPGANALQIDLPGAVLDCNSEFVPASQEEVGTLPADTTISKRIYRGADGFEMLMTVVMMGTDRTSIHKPQFCLVGQGWVIEKTEEVSVRIAKPRPYELKVMRLSAGRTMKLAEGRETPVRGVYVYWFVAEDRLTARHWERMWWMARDLLRTGVLQRWAYVSCFSICRPGQEEGTYIRMKQILAASVPEFQTAVGPELAATAPAGGVASERAGPGEAPVARP